MSKRKPNWTDWEKMILKGEYEKRKAVLSTGTWPMDLNFPVFAMGVRIFKASNDVGPQFLGPGSTRILEINTR
jgi:hypothetical protein